MEPREQWLGTPRIHSSAPRSEEPAAAIDGTNGTDDQIATDYGCAARESQDDETTKHQSVTVVGALDSRH